MYKYTLSSSNNQNQEKKKKKKDVFILLVMSASETLDYKKVLFFERERKLMNVVVFWDIWKITYILCDFIKVKGIVGSKKGRLAEPNEVFERRILKEEELIFLIDSFHLKSHIFWSYSLWNI